MKKYIFASCLALSAVLALSSSVAQAASERKSLGKFGDWKAYYFMEGKSKVCFMSSSPKEQRGLGNRKRGDVLLFITHWSGDGTKNVVSVSTGYTYKKDSSVKVKVNGKTYSMFTENSMAWASNQAADNSLAKSIQKGSRVLVTGRSSRGTVITDVYGLKGSGKAYSAITKACKM